MKKFLFTLCLLFGVAACAWAVFLKVPTTVTTVTVPAATPTLVAASTAGVQRVLFILRNQGTNTAFYGRSIAVHTTNGMELAVGDVLNREAPLTDNGAFWIYSESGTTVGVEQGFEQ